MNRTLAHFFSVVGHPIFVLTYILLLMLAISPYAFGMGSMTEKRGVLLITAVVVSTVFLPGVSMGLMKALGMVQTWQLADKQERIGPFIASGVFYLWLFKNLFSGAQTPILYTAFVLGATISLFVCFFINNFSKISVHAAGMGGLVAMLILLPFSWNEATEMVPVLGYYLSWPVVIALGALLAGAVGTARLALGAHTPAELYRGYVAGAVSVFFATGLIA
jgi:hypothetical protein